MGQRALRTAAIGLGMLMGAPMMEGQGCALCYTQAASSGARMVEALRDGIFVLIVPSVVVCTLLLVLAYQRRNEFRADGYQEGEEWKQG